MQKARVGLPQVTPKIGEIADQFGFDPHKESQFLWIAEEAAKDRKDPNWKEFQDDKGEIAFYHPKLKLLQKMHPMLNRFKKLFEKQAQFFKAHNRPTGPESVQRMEMQLSVLLNEAMNRSHKGLPPITPEILEALCVLLSVDTFGGDYFLACIVKNSLELYVEKQYALATSAEILADPQDFLKFIRSEQVRLFVLEGLEDVVMCQECEIRSAKIKCEQCKDFFCRSCFGDTHATGKRKSHSTNMVEQEVCAICDKRLAASVVCAGTVDAKPFCDICYNDVARETPDIRKLPKKILQGLQCYECQVQEANMICEDCVDLFCSECYIKLHRRGRRTTHIPLIIDQNGEVWRGGIAIPPEDAQELIDKARQTAEGGPWVAMKDDQLNTYWYHLRDKITTVQSPYA